MHKLKTQSDMKQILSQNCEFNEKKTASEILHQMNK